MFNFELRSAKVIVRFRYVVLALVFIGMQIADVVTTNVSLAHGNSEANPLMWFSMETFGSYYWAPKMAVALGVAALISICPPTKFGRRCVTSLMVLCGGIIVNNLVVISLS